MGTNTGSLVQACDRADGQEVVSGSTQQSADPQDQRFRDSRAASDSLTKEIEAARHAINPQTPPAACPALPAAQSDKSQTSTGEFLQHNAGLWGHKPRQEGASTEAASPTAAGKVTWPGKHTVAISLDATTAALVKNLAKQVAGCYSSPAGLQLQSASGEQANVGSISECEAAQPRHSMQLTPAAPIAGEPTTMEVNHHELLQPAALLPPEQPEACKGIPVQPDARSEAPETDDNDPQHSPAKVHATSPCAQPPTQPAGAGAAAAQPRSPEQPAAPAQMIQVAGRAAAACKARQLPPGFNRRVYCSQPQRVRGRDGVRRFDLYFAAICPRHGDSANLRSYADIRLFLDKHRSCVNQWEHLAQQPAEENKDFKQRMKEVGLHLFTARSALPGTEVLQQVLQIGKVEAADIIHASEDNTSSLAARMPAAIATRMNDQAVRSALSAECDGPEDADYNYSSDADKEYEEGGAEEQEIAAEPMQQCESQEEEVLLMQPLPHGFEVRAMLERRPNGTALRTYFTAQCASHAVTKKLTSPVHLMRFLDKHGPHMGCSDVLRGNLTNEAYAERLKSLGLRFSCKKLVEDEPVERQLQRRLGISASYAANIAHASGLASSAKAAKESADHTTESDFHPKAAKETDPDSDVKMCQQTPDNDGAEQMDVDSNNEELAGVAIVQPQLPAGFSLYVWRDCKSTHRSQCLHVHVKGHCKRCNANRVLNGFAMLRAFLQKLGSCRPEWGGLVQRQGESEAEHNERLRAACFRFHDRVVRSNDCVEHVLLAMLEINAARAAAIARTCGFHQTSSSGAPPTQVPGDVADGMQGGGNALKAMTASGGKAAPSCLPAGFSADLYIERRAAGGKILRVNFRPLCLKHNMAPMLATHTALRSFLDNHAACRPEWQPLALQPNESEADHTARMKGAGLRFCSRVLGPRDSVADVLQKLLSITAAEAAAIANDAGCSADAATGGPSSDGCCDAIAEAPMAATGTVGSEARAASPDRPIGKVMEGSAAVQATRPAAHPSLPIGFSTFAYIQAKGTLSRHDALRTGLRAHCPKHNRATQYKNWQHLTKFVDKHANCRPEWQQLCSRAQESEKEHVARLKLAGLLFHGRLIKPGKHPVDMLQAMLSIPRSEAAAIAYASGVSGSPPVAPSEDAAAFTASPSSPVDEGGAGNAAEQEHGPLAEPQLLQLPIGFTIGTYLERKHSGAISLRVIFRAECSEHNCAVKLHSSSKLRSFINKHAACRPEWQMLAAREDESTVEHDQRLQRAGLRFRAQVIKPGKSFVETLQDMLGISAAEAAAIADPTPASPTPGPGDSAAGVSPVSLENTGAAAALPGPPAGRCGDKITERQRASPWSSLKLPRGLTIAVHRELTLSGTEDKLCVYFKGLCLKHYADEDLRTLEQLKVFLEEHAVCRQEWQRLCKQPGESCEQHDARLEAAGLSFRTCTIQPREAVWEALQQMLGMSPAEAWKIASASGHGSIGGGIARPLERSGAGAVAAGNATAEAAGPAGRRAPPQLPAGVNRVLHVQGHGTKRVRAMANLHVVCARHKTQRSPRGYTEFRSFMAAHAECMPAWRGLEQQEGESLEEHRERLKGAGLTFFQRKMPATLWQRPAAAFLQECLGVSRQMAVALVKTASGTRTGVPDRAIAAGQPSPSGSGDDSGEENRDADEGNSNSDGEEVWAQGGHRAGGAGGGGGYGQGEYLGEDEPDEAPGAGQANGWGVAGDDDDDDEDDDYEGRDEGMEEEEGEDDDDDVEIVEHDAVDVAVMQHAAAAPNQAPAAGAGAANLAAVPVQVAGPSSPDADVLQARAEVAEGEVKMLRNNMKHARKVNEQLQAIIKKQAEQIKSLEAYNRAATTKNALAIGLSVTGMAAVRVIAAAAAVPGTASAAHAPAPVAAAPAPAAAADVPTGSAHAPAAAGAAAATPQPRGRAAAAKAGARGLKGGMETPAGERAGRDGRGNGPAPAQEDSNGRFPRRGLVGAAVTSAGPNSAPLSTRIASQPQSGGRGRGGRRGGGRARFAGRLAPSVAGATAVERHQLSEAPGSGGRFKRERAYLEGAFGPDSPRSARKAATKPAQRFDPTPMTRQQQAAAATQHPAEGAGARATESTSPAAQNRNRIAVSTTTAPNRAAAAAAPDQAPPAKRPKFPFRLVKEPRKVSAAERAGRKRPAEGQPATAEADAVRRRLLRAAEISRAFAASLVQAPDRQTEGDILRFCAGRIKEEKHRISDARRKSL
ncbi:g2841 [Coccomyxa elongata]